MKLPVKISLSASVISIFFMLLLFNNIHNQLTISQKNIEIEKNKKDLENLKNTTDLILKKAENSLTIISIADIHRKDLNKKMKNRFEFYMKNIPEISELKFISIDGEALVTVSNKRLYNKKDTNSYLDKKCFRAAFQEKFFIGNIYFSSDNNEMMVDISRKVISINSDKILGVIIAKISMYSIQEMISDKLIDFDAIALLNTDTNKFLYKSSYANKIQEEKLLSSNKDVSNIIYNNESYLMVSSPYKNHQLNLKFFVLTKESTLFLDITKTIKENLQLLLITIFVSSFIMFFMIRHMLKPLKKLSNNIKLLSNEIDAKRLNSIEHNLDEVQEIKHYFDGFVKLIKEDKQKLNDFNLNLKNKVDEEILKNQEKEQMLFQQSKMAAMGEMIGNIAHQWRQPIAIISMWANNIIADIDMDGLEDESLRKYAHKINEQTKHLSQTIDDFRNFFTPNKEKNRFKLQNSIDKTMNLLTASFKTYNIEVIENIKDVEITALENELTQAILNIIKNAKDIIITLPKDSKKLIFIHVYKKENMATIEIIDNGGGVSKEIKDKIFEPYFTTKHKSQGTGIGLYMTESIITKHLHGEISVENIEYLYNSITYVGAKFTITIPIN